MTRYRALIAGVVAIVTIASLLTGVGAADYALGEAVWVLLPAQTPAPYAFLVVVAAEQPDPLLSLLASRAPPSLLFA